MTKNEAAQKAVEEVLKDRGLELKVVKKSDSLFMRSLGLAVRIFNPRFMTDYYTTIPFLRTVYVPDSGTLPWRTLAHEGMHAEQARHEGQLIFALKYMFPQWMTLLAFLAIGAIFWLPMLWFLLFLVFAAPWPAPWRVRYEREAYRISAAMDSLMGFDVRTFDYLDYMVDHYVGWDYYHMSWDKERLEPQIQADMFSAEDLAENDTHEGDGIPYEVEVIWAAKTALEDE